MNKANTTDTETPFLDLHLSIANGFVSSRIYDKRDGFDIVNFLFWMVTFLAMLLMLYTFRNLLGLLESAIKLSFSANVYDVYVADLIARNECLTTKLLQQGYRYHILHL